MPIIQHPALGRVAFPDGMPLEAIKQAIVAHLGQQTAPENKGMIGSAVQALGVPTTLPEMQAVADQNDPLQHPSNILGPMAPMMRGFGQNVGNRLQNMYHESREAGENIANGQPVAQNVGKAGLSGLQALFSMIPGVGENANTAGMQVALGNNSGATGTMLGTLLPFAAGALGEKPSISQKTLPLPSSAASEIRPFESPFLKQSDVPQTLRDHVTNGGGQYKGAMEGTNLVFFNDPQTNSTLAMPSYLINSPDAIAQHMRMSRLEFAKTRAASAGAGGSSPNPNGAGGISVPSQPMLPAKASPVQTSFTPLRADELGGKIFYHGTPKQLGSMSAIDVNNANVQGLYGPGVYLTDNPNVASGYMRGKPGQVLSTRLPEGLKMLDLDQPLGEAERGAFNKVYKDPFLDSDLPEIPKGAKGTDAFNHLQQALSDSGLTTSDAWDFYDSLHGQLNDMGYHGLKHVGGGKVGKVPHNVAIFFSDNNGNTPKVLK